jgi:hypothetical protein
MYQSARGKPRNDEGLAPGRTVQGYPQAGRKVGYFVL